jgi:hypothetical protein
MAKVYPEITDELKAFIEAQPMYFVATAPLQADGHINLSPKGLDSLRVTAAHEILILDLTGSGNETAAHVLENQRMTVMLCAFEGKPVILRLYGKARVVLPDDKEWTELRKHFVANIPGVRQIFQIDVQRVQTSCGFGVPLMDLREQRQLLTDWAEKKGDNELAEYRRTKNSYSIDGLPAPEYDQKKS